MIHPKAQLKKIMKRFLADPNRGISHTLFSELAGISRKHLLDVFDYETEPLTEYMQRRVSKAYTAWCNGEVAIMQNRDASRFVEYRKEAKPVLQKTTRLQLVNGEIKISVGVKPKYDYGKTTLDEQLKRG